MVGAGSADHGRAICCFASGELRPDEAQAFEEAEPRAHIIGHADHHRDHADPCRGVLGLVGGRRLDREIGRGAGRGDLQHRDRPGAGRDIERLARATPDPQRLPVPTLRPVFAIDDAAGVAAYLLRDSERFEYTAP